MQQFADVIDSNRVTNDSRIRVTDDNRVIVASNYLPYTVKPVSTTKVFIHANIREKLQLVSASKSEVLDSPFTEEYPSLTPNEGRRSSMDRMHAKLFDIQLEDVYQHESPPDVSTLIMESEFEDLESKTPNFKVVPYYDGNAGLVNGVLSSGLLGQSRLWIGTLAHELPLSTADKLDISSNLRKNHGCIVIEDDLNAYFRFCKKIMWPIFHNMLPDQQLAFQTNGNMGDWGAYVKVNECFAEAICKEYQPGDIIWVNDYHLMLVPQMVRVLKPEAIIGFFLHVPFPTSEIFRCLPVRQEILEGILASDLIGFQTYGYARHFFQCCTRIMGYSCSPRGVQVESRVAAIGIHPIGIDPSRIQQKLRSDKVLEVMNHFKDKYSGRKIIIARDKVDPVKGIKQKLLGFVQFLQDNPDWRGKVVLVQIAVAGHDRYLQGVVDLVDDINARFGSLEQSPVILMTQDVSFEHYLALMSAADMCLITSLRDGMNLTSHEFVLCQQSNHGVVLISEFAGTSSTFSSAIRINPWDPMV